MVLMVTMVFTTDYEWIKMAKSARENEHNWRQRRIAEGHKAILVWLGPEAAKDLEELRAHYGKLRKRKNTALFSRAIKLLHDSELK